MNLVLKTAPAVEPVSLTEAKAHLRVDYDDDDVALITPMIKAARMYCENFQNRAYVTQTWTMYLPWFHKVIKIPKGSLQTVNSVKYKNSDGTEVTLTENVNYIYSKTGIEGILTTPYGVTWPAFTQYPLDAVTIEFTCGYGLAVAVPETIKQAILMLVKYWYDQKDISITISNDIQQAVHRLLWQDRILSV
jgi:uncharacterized phiE125 gp8 family phage protein